MSDTTDLIQRLKAFRGLWLGDGMHPSVERQKVIDALEQQAAQIEALRADAERQATPDQILELCEALETRRILNEIKKVATLHPADDMPTPFQSAWQTCCEEIFYRATGEQWHMDEDARKFARAANDSDIDAALRQEQPTKGEGNAN